MYCSGSYREGREGGREEREEGREGGWGGGLRRVKQIIQLTALRHTYIISRCYYNCLYLLPYGKALYTPDLPPVSVGEKWQASRFIAAVIFDQVMW